ncbi:MULTISPECIES: ATP-dependent zinc metalloprotease FtsH [Pseudothermotoga]|uniref:ATP-dependent zinc metalloprotease FtsH n=1 Tax=Pseudothermotoga lettingae (strain ATCC BAA-301 / DSM 14385 / NBRC 107922 / TMO) TaxID=416591 RepID=FTSH_PSELT|nr:MULTISPECIES: ATP-dependent zinc metalloprotease FtsH [Pseudothermotoga]A8F7F7.1 RecName: Full=ATP-dependent zinc metalloprotease FtsH [Pseudothermotoga lettingae TMO]ABV34091.1 ATP-dependent metalloprotease FtsH [Pseudothermotoga lettingae TMO]KUK21164.1 MAG: ATP-dependent zinc metalloprotease FtsH [Pseudothermotoga lettingae]MDI3494664.1 cell division protease FtsH [Pseudothermotoga sp.]MDK2884716.1 cell division protease FtsH [Pseudothermotoga sp.]GLI48970.1 ATP-dependent zinc metallopr
MNGNRPNYISLIFAALVILSLFWLVRSFYFDTSAPSKMSFSDFIQMAYEEPTRIAEVVVRDDGILRVTTKRGEYYEIYAPWFMQDSETIKVLSEKGVRVTGEKGVSSSFWVNVIGNVIFIGFLLFMFFFMMRTISGRNNQAFTFTKSRAQMNRPGQARVTFKDVAGVDEAVEELKETVLFLKDPGRFSKIGARMPKGILLVGPPGTGKTLLARAVAGEANVPFFHISGSDFVELFVGVGAARVRDLFNQAKANAPCIVFIDEIDAVGRHRGAGLGGGHDEREQTLNQLLVEMDGFDVRQGIVVMAATNRPDILDPALLRPGRFDKKVVLDTPDVRGREEILKIHARNKPIAEDVDIRVLAQRTTGFVGADLENLVNEAALLAARNGRDKIKMEDFEEAIDRVIAGPARKSRVISPREKRIVAYHEVGHAIVSSLLPNADPVHRISIIPRGYRALGYTLQLPAEDRYLVTKQELLDQITGLLGGRAAEELIFQEVTTGAASDIERATELARRMVCQFGMSDKLGPLSWGKTEQEIFLGKELTRMRNYSEEVASEIDEEVRKIVTESYDRAKEILTKYHKQLDELVELLLEREVLEGEELRKILKTELGEEMVNHDKLRAAAGSEQDS